MKYCFHHFLVEETEAEVRQLAQGCSQTLHPPCPRSLPRVGSIGILTGQMKESRLPEIQRATQGQARGRQSQGSKDIWGGLVSGHNSDLLFAPFIYQWGD